jgi:hypothetical protein
LGTQYIAGLTQGVPYFVRVRAYNQEGYGEGTTAVPVFGGAAQVLMRVPGRVTGAALTVVSGSQLRVTWSPPLDNGGDVVTSYEVQVSTASDFANAELHALDYIVDAGPYTKVINGLVQGTRYYVRVLALNSQGESDPQSPTPPYETPRQLPRSPAAVVLYASSASTLTVSWDAPADNGGDEVSYYQIEWDTDAHFDGMLGMPHRGAVQRAADVDASFTITNLHAGVPYFVRVRAGNQVGLGGATVAPNAVAPSRQLPGLPASVQVADNGGATGISVPAGAMLVQFDAPIVPAHGVPCSGGAGSVDAQPCTDGMGRGVEADGGSAIHAYSVQWSLYSDFSDVVNAGGSTLVPVPDGHSGGFHVVAPPTGSLHSGTYFVRVAALNDEGVGAYCERDGTLCDGAALEVQIA